VIGSRWSAHPPRRHALAMPSKAPSTKLAIVAVPTRNNVHGGAEPMTDDTVARERLIKVPQLAVQHVPQISSVLREE
jgi:hypothetical protein